MSIAIPYVGSVSYEPHGEVFPTFKKFGQHLKDHFVPHHRNNYHPHVLSHRVVALFSLLLVTVKVGSVVLLSLGPVAPAYSSAITTENIISLTNSSREEFGIGSLVENALLSTAAQAKANDMLARQYFSHNTPDGKTPWDFIKAAGYVYVVAGENLAVDFEEAENVESAWMNSPGHRANILNDNFSEIGIGIAQGEFEGHNSIIVVQMFGARSEQPIQTLAEPTQVQPATQPTPTQQQPQVAQAQTQPIVESASQVGSEPVAEQSTAVAEPTPATAAVASPSALITSEEIPTLISVSAGNVEILAWAPQASRMVAQFGEGAVMFSPVSNEIWKAIMPLEDAVAGSAMITVEAYGFDGKLGAVRVASFSDSLVGNFGAAPSVAGAMVSIFGKTFDVKQYENKFYLVFISLVLMSLIVAIAVHRHVQHVNMIANGSFAAIFATLLWYFG